MVASNLEAVMANRIAVYVVSLGCGRVMPLSGADVAGCDIPFAFCNLLLLFFSFSPGRTSEQFSFRWGGVRSIDWPLPVNCHCSQSLGPFLFLDDWKTEASLGLEEGSLQYFTLLNPPHEANPSTLGQLPATGCL
jgi:hypothetical protein